MFSFTLAFAALLFGGPLHSQVPEAVECPPGVSAGDYVPETDTYYFGRGDSPARIAESYASLRWQGFISLNPYLEERLSFDVTVGDQTYLAYADVAICEPLSGLQLLGLVPANLADEEPATTPVVTPPPPIVVAEAASEGAGPISWMLFFLAAVVFVIYLLLSRRRLKFDVESSNRESRHWREQYDQEQQRLSSALADYRNQLAEQRQLDFVARRRMMPPLPDGVEDAVLAGPPMRPEGVTEDNREEVLEGTALAAYQRLHPGVQTDGLVFERRDVRRVLISSRPGETFQMTFGDDKSREVTLVREPGWIFDAVIRRGDEVIQELEGICVVGFCANTFEYRRSWIVGALVEPYEYAAIHSVPDWEAVEANRANRQLTIHSLGSNTIVVARGGEPAFVAESILVETEGDIRSDGEGIVVSGLMHIVPAKTETEAETRPEVVPVSEMDLVEESAVTAGK